MRGCLNSTVQSVKWGSSGSSIRIRGVPLAPANAVAMGNWRDDMLMLLTLARWKWKMGRRALYHEVVHTLSGKLSMVLIIVALPTLITLVTQGAGARLLPGSGVLDGMLVAAHLALALAFVAFVPPTRVFNFACNELPNDAADVVLFNA